MRLVDELSWLNTIVVQATLHRPGMLPNPRIVRVKLSVAQLLDLGAQLLDDPTADLAAIRYLAYPQSSTSRQQLEENFADLNPPLTPAPARDIFIPLQACLIPRQAAMPMPIPLK